MRTRQAGQVDHVRSTFPHHSYSKTRAGARSSHACRQPSPHHTMRPSDVAVAALLARPDSTSHVCPASLTRIAAPRNQGWLRYKLRPPYLAQAALLARPHSTRHLRPAPLPRIPPPLNPGWSRYKLHPSYVAQAALLARPYSTIHLRPPPISPIAGPRATIKLTHTHLDLSAFASL